MGELAKDAGSQGARRIGRNEFGRLADRGRPSDLVVGEHLPSRALEEERDPFVPALDRIEVSERRAPEIGSSAPSARCAGRTARRAVRMEAWSRPRDRFGLIDLAPEFECPLEVAERLRECEGLDRVHRPHRRTTSRAVGRS